MEKEPKYKKNMNNMREFKRNNLYEFFRFNAPHAKFSECYDIIFEHAKLYANEYYYKCILSILALTVLGYNEHGGIPKELEEKHKNNRAVMLALKEAQACHSWTACGPVEYPEERIIEEFGGEDETSPQPGEEE